MYFCIKIDIFMDELVKNVDVKEMGRRFKLVRQRLGLTQTEVAKELDTTQLMIHRIEKGDNILSPMFLALILFYSRSVSLEGLLGKNFDIEDESLFSKDYAVNTIVKAKLNAIRDEYLGKLKEAENRSARFRTAVALVQNGEEHLFEGIVEGEILMQKVGEGGFGYDPVFAPLEGNGLAFAQMSAEDKNAISHRGRAITKLVEFLKNFS